MMRGCAVRTGSVATGVFLLCVALLSSGSALAQETERDLYSETSGKKLVLLSNVGSNVSDGLVRRFVAAMDMRIAHFKRAGIDDAEISQWCERAAEDYQIRGEDTDAKGQARKTLTAFRRACSDLYGMGVTLKKGCKTVVKKEKKKKKTVKVKYRECTVDAMVGIVKYEARVEEGALAGFDTDRDFGKSGKMVVRRSASSEVEITGRRSAGQADREALKDAIHEAGQWTGFRLKKEKDFSAHSPVDYADADVAKVCLGLDTVRMDTPFHIVVSTDDGEKRMGFVKARVVRDGCFATTAIQARRARGGKVDLGPLDAEIILGSGDIQQGMTAWEMATLGLNVGFHGGFSSLVGAEMGTMFGIPVEYNLGRYLNSSELHAFMDVNIGLTGDATSLQNLFVDAYPSFGIVQDVDAFPEQALAVMGTVGLFKRWYSHALFFDFGAGVAASYYLIDRYENDWGEATEMSVRGLGAAVIAGLGIQLAPRWMLRAHGGYRASIHIPVLTFIDSDGNEEDADPESSFTAPTEHGPTLDVGILYTF